MLFRSAAASLVALAALAATATATAISLETDGTLEARAVSRQTKTCKGTGQYPIPINGVCKPCTAKFDGAATCTTTAITKCKTGVLSAGKCVTTCPASNYNDSGVCKTCTSKFAGASTCTAAGATKCATGYLVSGKCAAVCPSQFVNNPSLNTCSACSTIKNAKTCAAGKVASCQDGSFLAANKLSCSSCTTLDKRATVCTATTVTKCQSPFVPSKNGKSCVLPSNTWSYYLASTIPDISYNAVQSSSIKCGRHAMGLSNPLAVYDPDSDYCFEEPSTNSSIISTLVWDSDNTVFLYGTCATNNKLVPTDAKSRCYDAIMTSTACTLTASQQACSVMLNECDGDQFRNYNGQCQDCQAAYPDALTCDIYNGATSCVDGDYLVDGTCYDCTASATFGQDQNIETCSASAILSCNYGFAPASDGLSCVATAMGGNGMLSNDWSYYMDSYVTGGTAFPGDGTIANAVDCAEQVFGANITLAAYDGTTCYSAARTDALVGAIVLTDGASTFVMGACTDNQAAATDDAASVCYDATLTELACTLDDGTNCQ